MLEEGVWLLTAYYKQSSDYKTIFEECHQISKCANAKSSNSNEYAQ